jgi:very-short-patch-repair endonuclease
MSEVLTTRARALRRDATETEKRLWHHLRHRQVGGCKFRRQQPLGRFIVDFVCLEKRLVVELDGGQHAAQRSADEARDAWLASQGFRILRFWDNQVFEEPQAILREIWEALGCSEVKEGPPGLQKTIYNPGGF